MQFDGSSTYRSMRSSLYPFVRNEQQGPQEKYQSDQDNRSVFQIKRNLLQRYHDQSYIVKRKPPNNIQKYAKVLQRINLIFKSKTMSPQSSQQVEQKSTINPDSKILFAWNLLVVLSILYHFFQIPIVLFFTSNAFNSEFSNGGTITVNAISLVVLFLNIVYVIPNTQYYHNGFLVTNHQKIIWRYLGWRMVLDIYCWIVLFVFIVSKVYTLIYWKVTFYFMIYRLIKSDEALQKKVQLTKVRLAAYKLTRIILLLLFLVLWLGSIFFALDYHYYTLGADSEYQGPLYLWLMGSAAMNDFDIIANYQWQVWLAYSLYWAIQTVTMVGFGDITAKNPHEVIYVSIVITVIVISYAFFITGVWQIVSQARQFNDYQIKQWKIYKEYQQQNMKPLDKNKYVLQTGTRYRQLKNKVGSYLFQMWSYEKVYTQTNVVEVLEKSLTPELKDQVFINYRQHLFQRINLFSQLAQSQKKYYNYIFRGLIFKIKQRKYAKDEYVIQLKQINKNLIYLVNGKMRLYYPNSNYQRTFKHYFSDIKYNKDVYITNENYNFGVKQFFTEQKMPYSVIAQSFCKTSELSYVDFIESLKQIEQFYYKYCQLRDNLKFYNNDFLTGQECIECGSKDHDLFECRYCDIVMNYRKNLLKTTKMNNIFKREENKEKCPKLAFRRKLVKSTKFYSSNFKINREAIIDQINSFSSYYPDHNL